MLSNIFDSHAHYNDASFREDMDSVLSSLPEKGVSGVINCGTDLDSSIISSFLSEQYEFVYFASGIHPEDCGDKTLGDLEGIKKLLQHKKCVAVGEIGLDFHWSEPSKETQLLFFEQQLKIAKEFNKPVIIHDREAHALTLEMIKKYRPVGVLHCFSGSVETMREALKLGMYIGLGGAVTFKNAKKAAEAAKAVPEDRLLLETDCPYMAPVPLRGSRNESSFIAHTAEFIAQLRNTDPQELINKCTENTKKLFFGA
ncbi:MAG: TatD family hydrolase [Oscillospiraceae bacterium]|nr:TatD family hydrolase [Oscillospiraceae bacterium]